LSRNFAIAFGHSGPIAMRSFCNMIEVRPRRIATACLMAGLVTLGPAVWAEDATPTPPAAQPVPEQKPGVFESIGRFFDKGASNFSEHLRGAKRKMDELGDDAAANNKAIADQAAKVGQGAAEVGKGAAEVGKGAADATISAMGAVAKIPTARMMSGRERCATAPNGAPDCVSAAEALCRKHGFTSGKSMDFTSAEECPVRTLLGQSDDCTTVTFISRAMCQ
jgi:hypothetical protein